MDKVSELSMELYRSKKDLSQAYDSVDRLRKEVSFLQKHRDQLQEHVKQLTDVVEKTRLKDIKYETALSKLSDVGNYRVDRFGTINWACLELSSRDFDTPWEYAEYVLKKEKNDGDL